MIEKRLLKSVKTFTCNIFFGYSLFTDEPPFDASLFVEFCKRLELEQINAINERIVKIKIDLELSNQPQKDNSKEDSHRGNHILDATACLQDIAYPTNLDLLNERREKYLKTAQKKE